MRLWLDDLRTTPPGWTHACTAQEAEELALHNDIEDMSLDYDLGCVGLKGNCPACQLHAPPDAQHIIAPTGKNFLLWMIETNHWPKNKPHVHSQNLPAREQMRHMIDDFGPYDKEP